MMKAETDRLFDTYTVHALHLSEDPDALVEEVKDRITAIATNGLLGASGELMARLTNLKAVICF